MRLSTPDWCTVIVVGIFLPARQKSRACLAVSIVFCIGSKWGKHTFNFPVPVIIATYIQSTLSAVYVSFKRYHALGCSILLNLVTWRNLSYSWAGTAECIVCIFAQRVLGIVE